MKKNKTRLLTFNYEKYKAGAKAVFRNNDAATIIYIIKQNNEIYPYIVVSKNDDYGGYEEVSRVELLEAIEILDVTEKARKSIKNVKIWEA